MSQVFSFRLDENNPREAQAIEVIEAWASRGYSLRYVLVEALKNLKEKDSSKEDLSTSIEEVIRMLQNLRVGSDHPRDEQGRDKQLSEAFLEAVLKTGKPGMRAENLSHR